MPFKAGDLLFSIKARDGADAPRALLEECRAATQIQHEIAKAELECGRTPFGQTRVAMRDFSLEKLKSALQAMVDDIDQ